VASALTKFVVYSPENNLLFALSTTGSYKWRRYHIIMMCKEPVVFDRRVLGVGVEMGKESQSFILTTL